LKIKSDGTVEVVKEKDPEYKTVGGRLVEIKQGEVPQVVLEKEKDVEYKIFGDEMIKINPDGTTEVVRDKPGKQPEYKEFPQADRTKIFAKWMGPDYKQTPRDKKTGTELEYKFISQYSMDKEDTQSWSDRKKAVVKYATAQEKRYLDIKHKKHIDIFSGKPFIDWQEEEHGPSLKFYQEIVANPDKWMKVNEGLPVYKEPEPEPEPEPETVIPKFKFEE
jgi:hypothetical protein